MLCTLGGNCLTFGDVTESVYFDSGSLIVSNLKDTSSSANNYFSD